MALATGILEVTTALETTFGRFETIVNKYFERGDVAEDNKFLLARIQRKYKRIQKQLPHGKSVVEHDMHLHDSLCEMVIELQEELGRVFAMEESITSGKRFKRVKRMERILQNCETLEEKLLEVLHDNALRTSPPISSSSDYVRASNVPPNPPRLTLDYTNSDTFEGKLKAAILGQLGQRIIALIASGEGGVGKTCALRGLADDLEIRQRFPGGILYIELGNDAKMSDIIDGLEIIVNRTGGKSLSEEIKAQETVQKACNMAAPWFEQQTCLFLIDDVWNLNGIDATTVTLLGEIVHGNSRMVYTSRDKYFVDCAQQVIEFKPRTPDGETAHAMLLHHAGFSTNDYQLFDKETASAFNSILKECLGWPLALGIVGGAIFKLSLGYDDKNKTEVWTDYKSEMEKCSSMYDVAKKSNMEVVLRRIVDLSLDVLRERDEKIDFSFMFRALCVLQKQQSIPASALQKLWNLDGSEDVDKIISAFGDVSLVLTSTKRGVRYIQLHDLVLDLVKNEARRLGVWEETHNNLINNYSNKGDAVPSDGSHESSAVLIDSKIDEIEQKERKRYIQWWNVTADRYIHENVCRLLHDGAKIDELLWLLSRPEWIVYRFRNGGLLQVEADLNEGIAALGESASSGAQREHMDMIGKALRLSRPYISKNPSEMWFQLYGRLQWHATFNEWTAKFINSIERAATRPWVKAPMGVLQQASFHSQGILKSNGRILCIRIEKGVVWFVWAGDDKMGITSWDVYAEHEKNVKLDTTYFKENECVDEYYLYFKAAFSADGLSVTVVHDSLLTGTFNTKTGKSERCHQLDSHSDTPRRNIFRCCLPSGQKRTQARHETTRLVAISKNAKYIATSNDEHEVQIWGASNGERIGPSLRGHSELVKCLATNEDGTRVVTGDQLGTIRVWNAQSGEAIGKPLLGPIFKVVCLAISADCS